MTARRAWASLAIVIAIGSFAAPFLVPFHYLTNCSARPEGTGAALLAYGIPVAASIGLVCLALVEGSVRWRVTEFVISLLLIFPALWLGAYTAAGLTRCGVAPVLGGTYLPPEPTPWPSGTALQITDAGASSPVGREYSNEAAVSLRTLPGAKCTIDAHYHGAKAPIPGLDPQVAASPMGWVGWGWTIPKDAPLGVATYSVTCSLDKATVTWSDTFEVWQSVSPAPNS